MKLVWYMQQWENTLWEHVRWKLYFQSSISRNTEPEAVGIMIKRPKGALIIQINEGSPFLFAAVFLKELENIFSAFLYRVVAFSVRTIEWAFNTHYLKFVGEGKWCKGLGKRGHIVANTMLPTQMFPCLPAHAGTQKMFLILFRNILCPQQMFPSLRSPRNIIGNNVSATMCPRSPGALCQGTKSVFSYTQCSRSMYR